MVSMKKVLIDWDNPNVGGSWAIRRGLNLIAYGILKGLRISKLPKEIEKETDDYALMILKINDMVGVETIVGIRDPVRSAKGTTVDAMVNAGYDVRRHIHIGDRADPDRRRVWEPPLRQSPLTWHYDSDYVAGKPVKIPPGELPIWHFDKPYWMKYYIDFLYKEFYQVHKES